MRTSWVLFFALVFTFCKCWKYVPLASTVAQWIGFVVIVSSLSYWLARYIWTVAFVDLVSGEGKAVLVTGCDSGFGYYLVKSLSRMGFFVFAGCLDSGSDGANDLSKFANVKVLQMDISSEQQVNYALVTIKEGLGSRVLWAVVCNAAIRNEGLFEWVTMEAMKKVVDVNILGTCRVAKAFLPLLRKSNGRLVVVTSSFGYVTMPLGTPYSMTKHAAVSMVDGLRRECYGKGVDIIQVMPQAYKTNISAPLFSRGLTTDDLKKNCPEVADDFTQKEIDSWIDSSKNFYDILNRENLQEVADVMVLAVRETDPRTWYTTPWSLCTAVLFPFTYLPDEATDAIMAIARTKLTPLSNMLKNHRKNYSTTRVHP
ncbi:retinol dehydrogenase 7 isoform X2 [Rhipicephalus sanguineus]|uniref:retinol dehydrogenase 7 isoform X2 n=1 Tax=Rhipicephalus sanguineus TaxID=34632 RepID=UPI0020C3C166|nr:retinol dehydrogenase 7 isoform X2 [Rhipicephalus sanguineus]